MTAIMNDDFFEWWEKRYSMANLALHAAREAWEAAVVFERERCARIAEGPAEARGEFVGGTPERDRIAAAIRRRVE